MSALSNPSPEIKSVKMSNEESRILDISYINIHCQSNLTKVKQLQIQDFIKFKKIYILQKILILVRIHFPNVTLFPPISISYPTTVLTSIEQQLSYGLT